MLYCPRSHSNRHVDCLFDLTTIDDYLYICPLCVSFDFQTRLFSAYLS